MILLVAASVSVCSAQVFAGGKTHNIQLSGPALAGLPYCTFVNLSSSTLTDVTLRLIDSEGAYVFVEKTVDVPPGEGTAVSDASNVTQYCTVNYVGKADDGRAAHCTLDPGTLANEACVAVY